MSRQPSTPTEQAQTWLPRYLAGEHEQVWAEMHAAGEAVSAPPLREPAQAVCDETARRIRHDLELVVSRLRADGYRFHTNDDAQTPTEPLGPLPQPDVATAQLARLESTVGALPLLLHSWVRYVGDVWLVGTHPSWPASFGDDPLVLELVGTRYGNEAVLDYFASQHEEWLEEPWTPVFPLEVSPDDLHKQNVSGGDPYSLAVPCRGVDGLIDTGWPQPQPLIDYLRSMLANGGFLADEQDPTAVAVAARLTEDLLPF